jgi:formate dehydrogenase major subunit
MNAMSHSIPFLLDDKKVSALPGETILDCALRHETTIPHHCCQPGTSLPRPGRCRSCLIEIEGEQKLKASCRQLPHAGMQVWTDSPKVLAVRSTVTALHQSVKKSPRIDRLHPAISLDRDACIQCGLCIHACREIQCQDVLSFSGRGSDLDIAFDFELPVDNEVCVGCGQCIDACPTGAIKGNAYDTETVSGNTPKKHITQTLCPFCCVGCHINVHVQGNRIVGVNAGDGPTNKGRLCVKGRFGLDFIHHPARLTTPLLRIPEADKTKPISNWRQAFRPVSWDEALDAATTGLQQQTTIGGPDCLAFFGSLKTCNEDGYLLQKLARTAFHTNNIDHPTRLCHASSTAALLESVGIGAPSSQIAECMRADVVFVMGANLSSSHPVAGSFIRNAVRNGTKLIVADPRGQALDRFATHILRFKPGTDVVLLNAMIGVIIDEELVNRPFINARVDGFGDIARRCRDFPLASAAQICGVEADTLCAAARCFATAQAAMTIWGMGMTQHSHGTNNIRCLISMALICGHVGRPGSGLYPIRGHNNAQGAPDSGQLPNYLPDYQPIASSEVRNKFARLWNKDLPPEPGLTMLETIEAIDTGQITGLYVMGANPALCIPNLAKVRRALAKLNFLVVQDIFLTETASFADVILPTTAVLERDGTMTNIDRRIQLARAAVKPPGKTRQDWWIIQEIARRCGQNWSYKGPSDIFDEMRRAMPSIAGITWDRLEKEGAVQYPCRMECDPGTPFLFKKKFNTPNGKARLTPATDWTPASITSKEFPLIMTTGRILEHHTGPMSRRSSILNALEPIPFVLMNPMDMERLKITAGESVYIQSKDGQIKITARVDPTLPPGIIFAPFCYSEAAANELTCSAMDPDSKTGEMKYSTVAVTRIEK